MLIGFPTEYGSNLVAALPFALPLIFGAILLLLYQRYLPSTERRRNVIIFIGILGIVGAFILILYSGFGSMWWLPDDSASFGSYDLYYAILQRVSNMLFVYGIQYFMVYLIGTIIIFAFIARSVINPPDPDFTNLQSKLREIGEASEKMARGKKELEAENKRLSEFLREKEETLEVLQSELDGLKASVSEREGSIAEMESRLRESVEDDASKQELLETISKKDETISRIQSELADLRLIMESDERSPEKAVGAGEEKIQELEEKLKVVTARVNDYSRRAETASEVSDSVISDLAELISQIESSGLEQSTKKTLTTLIEGLGRSMGRIVGKPAEKDDAPKVELIGAVMMVHEIVDSIKKLSRK